MFGNEGEAAFGKFVDLLEHSGGNSGVDTACFEARNALFTHVHLCVHETLTKPNGGKRLPVTIFKSGT